MTSSQRMKRVAAIAAVAALIAGFTTGTLSTIRDEAWPGRGGMEAIFQIGFLFSLYGFLIALPVGATLAFTLSPWMAITGLNHLLLHVAIGLALGLLINLLVNLGIGERIDRLEDFLGGTLAGGGVSLLWWFYVQRHEEKAR